MGHIRLENLAHTCKWRQVIALVDASKSDHWRLYSSLRIARSRFDTADKMEIFRSVTGKSYSDAKDSGIVRTATVQLELP